MLVIEKEAYYLKALNFLFYYFLCILTKKHGENMMTIIIGKISLTDHHLLRDGQIMIRS